MLNNRFKKSFPLIYKIILNIRLMSFVCIMVAILFSFYSIHISLSVMSFFYVLLTHHLERRHLNTLLLTPLTIPSLQGFIGLGIGSILQTIGDNGEFDPSLFTMQVVYLLTFPLLVITYHFINRHVPDFYIPDMTTSNAQPFYNSLKIIGFIALCFTLISLIIGVSTGSFDRGVEGEFMLDKKFGIWSIADIFFRLFYLPFIFIPLLFRNSNLIMKIIVFLFLIVYFVVSYATGTRGFIFLPIIYLLIGYWLFKDSSKIIKRTVIVMGILGIYLIPSMAISRSTMEFYQSRLSNLTERLTIMVEASNQSIEKNDTSLNLLISARSLLGVSDTLIYELTPSIIPHAGWENIGALLYIWMPNIIFREKPILYDGDQIATKYRGIEFKRSFASISFNADMYRRFGWLGVFVGSLIYSLFYSMFFRGLFYIYYYKNTLFGFLLLIFSLIFVQQCSSTMLTTFWYWLWDLPKYIVIITLLYFVGARLAGIKKSFGARAYQPIHIAKK